MLEILKPPAPHVVAFEVSGRLDEEDMEIIVSQIDGALERHERINLLVDMSRLSGMSPKALLMDLMFGLNALGRMYRFARMAAITDNATVERIVRLEDRILSDIEIVTFGSSESDQALSWIEAWVAPPSPGLRVTELPNGMGLELEVGDEVSGYDIRRLTKTIRDLYEKSGPVHLLAKVERQPRSGPGLLYEKFRAMDLLSLVSKYAVVAPDSLRPRVAAMGAVVSVRLKHFPLGQYEKALAWLSDRSPTVELLPGDSPHLIELRLAGKITEREVKAVYQYLLPRLSGDDELDVLLEVPYHEGMTLRGVFEALKLGVKHFSEVTRGVRRLALITDSRWLSKALDLENLLLPGVDERPFTFAQRSIAQAWLQEGREEHPSTDPPSEEPGP